MTETQGAADWPTVPQHPEVALMLRNDGTVLLAPFDPEPGMTLEVQRMTDPYGMDWERPRQDWRWFNYQPAKRGYVAPAAWLCGALFRCRYHDRGIPGNWSLGQIVYNSETNMERHGG